MERADNYQNSHYNHYNSQYNNGEHHYSCVNEISTVKVPCLTEINFLRERHKMGLNQENQSGRAVKTPLAKSPGETNTELNCVRCLKSLENAIARIAGLLM